MLLLIAVPQIARAAVDVTVEGNVEVGADAVQKKLAEIGACVDGVAQNVDDVYKVELDLDGAGHVTALRTLESHVSDAAGACADNALRQVVWPPLAKPDATMTVTLALRMKSAAEARAEEKAAEKAAEPLPSEASPPQPGAQTGASQTGAAQPGAPQTGTGSQGQLQAVAEAKTEDAKPWKVTAELTQWIGEGTFVKDSFAATPDYGYLAALGASYKPIEQLSIGTKVIWLQQLTVTNKDTGTIPREVLFRDLTLSASAPKLYKEQNTGIDLGGGGTIYFPISKASRAQQRIFGVGIRGSAARTFEKLGPGDLTVSYFISGVKNVGPASADNDPGKHPTGELCRGGNRDGASGTCLTSNASNNYFVLNDFNVAYTFLEDFTVTVDLLIWNQISRRTSDGTPPQDLAAGANIPIGMSPYANTRASQSDRTVATIELAYAINKNFTVAAQLYTFQPVFIQDGSNSHALRFPFWDTRSAAENFSSFNLDVAFTY